MDFSAFVSGCAVLPLRSRVVGPQRSVVEEKSSFIVRCNRRARSRSLLRGVDASMSTELPHVMVNGVPGKMAAETAHAAVRRGLKLVPFALTGPGERSESIDIDGISVQLVKPAQRDAILADMKKQYPDLICVDYTHPSAANANVDAYAKAGLSFVIGTTGGDEAAMIEAVNAAPEVYAVIAPNMGKQIVAFQAMMDLFSKEFPGALEGYTMKMVESHQTTKADTSGTAKAVIRSINGLGVDFSVDEVERVRNEPEQLDRMQVPIKFLKGHAYHTYTLTSPDETVTLEFKHNVRGRLVYAEGTIDAVIWLARRRQANEAKRVYSMIDILRTGSMN